MLAYFDEKIDRCDNCDNCLSPKATEDLTDQAILTLQAVVETGQYFGVSHVIDVLIGALTEKVRSRGHHQLSCFGAGNSKSKQYFQSLVRQLVSSGYLKINLERYGAIQLTAQSEDIRSGQARFHAKIDSTFKATSSPKAKPKVITLDASEMDLFQALKETRLQLAKERGVPAFVVFSDATLREMALHKPKTERSFLNIKGVGRQKLDDYYDSFVETIIAFN